ncbi:MAG: hypothetical protein Aurels2KO_20120 [Aureliella sp.]
MTNRCRMLLILCLLGSAVGIFRQKDTLSLLCLAILVWIFGVWCLFRIRVLLASTSAMVERTVDGRPISTSPVLWTGREFEIEAKLTFGGRTLAVQCTAADFVPELVDRVAGDSAQSFSASATETTIRYTVTPKAAGGAVFPGVHLAMSDSYGFFLHEQFVNLNETLRCLPRYTTTPTMQPTVKRLNNLPQHGIHRLMRAGLGSELLELREYQSGDPPKSIAWKVSARRQQLMTRQYESEVPVRVTIFLDGHSPARSGTFGNRPIDQLNDLAANICSAAVRSGDAVGLVTIDEDGHRATKPAFGDRCLHQVLRAIADFSIRPNRTIRSITPGGIQRLTSICRYLFPDLMEQQTNQTAFSWRPLLPWNRANHFARVRLANLLSTLYNLSPLECCRLVTDDPLLGKYADRMLADYGQSHLVANTVPRNSERWAQSLCRSIHNAVIRAQDNEIFVILTDVIQYHDQLDPLLDAVKVAAGRHHRVVFVCPDRAGDKLSSRRSGLDAVAAQLHAGGTPAQIEAAILATASDLALDDAQRVVRRKIRRAGANVSFALPDTAVTTVMGQVQLASQGFVAGART